MIHFLNANDLLSQQRLQHGMFRDRAKQFSDRLKWDVTVDKNGQEKDYYDELNPLYAIVSDKSGNHMGSIRFLPTTGPTMLNDHFLHLNNGLPIRDVGIWECTRFCTAKGAGASVAVALLACGGRIMRGMGLNFLVGVFDKRMEILYRRLGHSPLVLGSAGQSQDYTAVGLWSFNDTSYQMLLSQANLSASDMDFAFKKSSAIIDEPILAHAG